MRLRRVCGSDIHVIDVGKNGGATVAELTRSRVRIIRQNILTTVDF